ncbi:hypothetical protein [Methylophaga sp. OBS4]|uniref:hypothetical protein n=1 Tax=Methylophaga sp. OBS4 TaxID=2991935 RepID=UPI00224EC533|nr:hypothetical protein [Methylophaga sp. OBS4]MCX4188193.1 hypothetical protein [Methylophaga sp. OBS4]
MEDREYLKLTNQQWQDDDLRWQQEMAEWQHETQRLVALLYMLEKALPEHSSKLEQHKLRITHHNEELARYRCGLDANCLTTCPNHIDLKQQRKQHQLMAKRHQSMIREHEAFSKDYRNKMHKFRELAEKLLKELEAFS